MLRIDHQAATQLRGNGNGNGNGSLHGRQFKAAMPGYFK